MTIDAIVAPVGVRSIAMMRACFVAGRAAETFGKRFLEEAAVWQPSQWIMAGKIACLGFCADA